MCPRQPGDDGTARQWPGARSVPGQPVTSPWAGRLRSGESRATHEGWGLSSRVWFWWLNAWVQWGPKKQSPKKAKHTSVFHRQIRDHRTNGAIKLTESGVGFPRSGRTAKRRGQWEAPALRLAVGGGGGHACAHATHTPRTRGWRAPRTALQAVRPVHASGCGASPQAPCARRHCPAAGCRRGRKPHAAPAHAARPRASPRAHRSLPSLAGQAALPPRRGGQGGSKALCASTPGASNGNVEIYCKLFCNMRPLTRGTVLRCPPARGDLQRRHLPRTPLAASRPGAEHSASHSVAVHARGPWLCLCDSRT